MGSHYEENLIIDLYCTLSEEKDDDFLTFSLLNLSYISRELHENGHQKTSRWFVYKGKHSRG